MDEIANDRTILNRFSMIDAAALTEEMNIRGVASLGKILSDEDIAWFLQDLRRKKEEDIAEFGIETLKANFSIETVNDLGRFAGKYYDLIGGDQLNTIVNTLLNDKAVIHSYNAIILDGKEKSEMVGHGFHRDMPWFPNCRTSIIVMIPLVDYGPDNGSTQFVPGTHAFRDMPSLDFLMKHRQSAVGKAGEAFVVDSCTWHRAGDNVSGLPRPMIVIKYTLAPFKQQVEFYLSNKELESAAPIVKQRLGWNVRVPHDYLENRDWNQETRKFKSGQYDMSNTYFK
ncbi:MAG: phytanoyl-CoA dioxygenase family protein [Bacteroidetes bacterium]|nr:phytanoyl-CoA dioxygenase family protein [Bacteroidota bacterium]